MIEQYRNQVTLTGHLRVLGGEPEEIDGALVVKLNLEICTTDYNNGAHKVVTHGGKKLKLLAAFFQGYEDVIDECRFLETTAFGLLHHTGEVYVTRFTFHVPESVRLRASEILDSLTVPQALEILGRYSERARASA
jgi:hypothetical protein